MSGQHVRIYPAHHANEHLQAGGSAVAATRHSDHRPEDCNMGAGRGVGAGDVGICSCNDLQKSEDSE